MVIYVDRLLALNTLVNYLLLSAAAGLTGETAARWRRWTAAALGACYALIVLLPDCPWMGMLSLKLLCAAVMAAVCFGFRRRLLRHWVLLLVLGALYGGAVLLIETLLGGSVTIVNGAAYYPVSFTALALTGVGLWLLFSTVLARMGSHSGGDLASVTLRMGDRSIDCKALRDTGNSLRDPVSGDPALVVDWQTLRRLLPGAPMHLPTDPIAAMALLRDYSKTVRLLPCKTVGGSGLLPALRCTEITIDGNPQPGALAAIAADGVSDGGAYQALTGGI